MQTTDLLQRQAQRLLRVGMVLFLFGLLAGLFVPLFTVPRIGLSVHLLGITQGIFLVIVGLLLPKLILNPIASRILFWLVIYGCFAAWSSNLLAGLWGAGNTMIPIAAGQAHGTPLQELIISIGLRSAAVSLITSVVIILWGLWHLSGEYSNK